MKKIVTYILIISITLVNIGFNYSRAYSEMLLIEPFNSGSLTKEQGYIKELTIISNQLDIISSNSLKSIIDDESKNEFLKDTTYLKSQIRSLRLELSEYHKTESGNIEKNPISLALLNTLNFYSMSLSYLIGVLESDNYSDESKYLEYYYTNKGSGDTMLSWVKEHIQ